MTDSTRYRRIDDGRDRPTAADDWEFGPEVPPVQAPEDYATDGGCARRPTARCDFDRPPRTGHSPDDRDTEEITPGVPDLR